MEKNKLKRKYAKHKKSVHADRSKSESKPSGSPTQMKVVIDKSATDVEVTPQTIPRRLTKYPGSKEVPHSRASSKKRQSGKPESSSKTRRSTRSPSIIKDKKRQTVKLDDTDKTGNRRDTKRATAAGQVHGSCASSSCIIHSRNKMIPSDRSHNHGHNHSFIQITSLRDLICKCTSPHHGRQIINVTLARNVDAVFDLLFGSGTFLIDFHNMRKTTDLQLGQWSHGKDGERTRVVHMTVKLQPGVGPKTAKVTEHQTLRKCSIPGELYSVDIKSVNAGIPYAEAFHINMHYCLTATAKSHTSVMVFAEIKFLKSVWAVVKGFIEKNTHAGLDEFFHALHMALLTETTRTGE